MSLDMRILFLVGIFVFSLSAYSQNYVIIKTGGIVSNITNSGGNPKLGFVGGLGYEYQLNESFWLAFQADYARKGNNLGVVANVTQYSHRFQYLDLSPQLKYRYIYSKNFTWSVVAGPYFSPTLKAQRRFFRIAQPELQDIPIDNENARAFDLGFNLGLEFDVKSDYGYLSFYVMGQYGFVTALTDIRGATGNNILGSVGFLYKFGKPVEYEID